MTEGCFNCGHVAYVHVPQVSACLVEGCSCRAYINQPPALTT